MRCYLHQSSSDPQQNNNNKKTVLWIIILLFVIRERDLPHNILQHRTIKHQKKTKECLKLKWSSSFNEIYINAYNYNSVSHFNEKAYRKNKSAHTKDLHICYFNLTDTRSLLLIPHLLFDSKFTCLQLTIVANGLYHLLITDHCTPLVLHVILL